MPPVPTTLGPIHAIDALECVEAKLLELLGGLTPLDWDAPTIVTGWNVRHVAAHLLDTALRKLSIVRDGFAVDRPSSGTPEDVRIFVNRLNAEGVTIYGRLSPEVLTALLSLVSREYCVFHRSLDPQQPAAFAVGWAGEEHSLNWFDTARELTERWHHQQQIRIALDRPGIMTRELYHPVLDCFMRVLPYTYRSVVAPTGGHLLVRVVGPSGGDWQLCRDADRWVLTRGLPDTPLARVAIPEAMAWRMFTKGIARDEAEQGVVFDGDRRLAAHVLDAVAIVG